MIIVVGGIKGGSGKTTLATNLAVLRSQHSKVLLIDGDEQRSTSDWMQQRRDLAHNWTLTTVSLLGKNVYAEISDLAQVYDDIIIDTGGRDTTTQRSALTVADKFIVPFKPRSLDIWTASAVLNLITEIHIVNHDLKTLLVLNQADSKGQDNEEALKILSQFEDFECTESIIGHRKAFSNAAGLGLGVVELEKPDKKATEEMVALYYEIYA